MNRFALVFVLLLAVPAGLGAQGPSWGLFNSPKGFGVSAESPVKGGTFNSFDLYADIYGLPNGRASSYPGVRIQALHNMVLRSYDKPGRSSFVYAGFGAAAGYVRDFESFSRWNGGPAYLIMNMGGIVCISGAFGVRCDFADVTLDLGLQADAGFYIRRHESHGNLMFELYRNGLYNSLYPQLRILWNMSGGGSSGGYRGKVSPFDFGVEWGSNVMFYSVINRNYVGRYGERVDDSSRGFAFYANGAVRLYAGVYAGEKLRFDLGAGYAGIADSRRVVPVTARMNFLPRGRFRDGAVVFVDAGASLSTVDRWQAGLLASAGAGYRKCLSSGAGLSLLANLRYAQDRPGIFSPDLGTYVPAGDIRNNAAGYLSAGITLSVDIIR